MFTFPTLESVKALSLTPARISQLSHNLLKFISLGIFAFMTEWKEP